MNKNGSIVAGLGAIAFGVLTVAAMILVNAPGGNYDEPTVAGYVAIGHLPIVILAGYVAMLGVLGLICLVCFLRQAIGGDANGGMAADVFWATGLSSAASFAVGWGLVTGIAVAAAEGGSSANVPHAATYVLSDTTLNVIWGSGGVLLGFALIALVIASRGMLPNWLRWATMVVGVLALAAPAYFPAFAIPVWAFAVGIWFIAGSRAQLGSATAVHGTMR